MKYLFIVILAFIAFPLIGYSQVSSNGTSPNRYILDPKLEDYVGTWRYSNSSNGDVFELNLFTKTVYNADLNVYIQVLQGKYKWAPGATSNSSQLIGPAQNTYYLPPSLDKGSTVRSAPARDEVFILVENVRTGDLYNAKLKLSTVNRDGRIDTLMSWALSPSPGVRVNEEVPTIYGLPKTVRLKKVQ